MARGKRNKNCRRTGRAKARKVEARTEKKGAIRCGPRFSARYRIAERETNKEVNFLWQMYSGVLRRSQVKTLSAVVLGMVESRQIDTDVVGVSIARRFGITGGSGRQRYMRLLRNEGVTSKGLLKGLLRFFRRFSEVELTVLDWTDWSKDCRLLVATVPVGTRGIPICARWIERKVRKGSMNLVEREFISWRTSYILHTLVLPRLDTIPTSPTWTTLSAYSRD